MIKYIVEALYSKMDRNGNCYWAMRVTDTETGKTVEGTVSGGESNIDSASRMMVSMQSNERHFSTSMLGVREFEQLTKAWEYAGCAPKDLAKWAEAKLRSPDGFYYQ